MRFKYEFVITTNNTVRLFVRFVNKEQKISWMKLCNWHYVRFQRLSIWRGHDKNEDDMLSWEFSKSLIPYFREVYSNFPDCTMRLGERE